MHVVLVKPLRHGAECLQRKEITSVTIKKYAFPQSLLKLSLMGIIILFLLHSSDTDEVSCKLPPTYITYMF